MKIPINQKTSNSKRFLRYKPRKGQESREWKIEGILNDRVTLKPFKQKKHSETTFDSKPVLNYVEQKQYEIAWQQQCQKGIWPNTWEPQDNIPDFTRLDYLLRKRSQLRISKKKAREMRIKSKQSFMQHHLFSMRKMKVKSETKIAFEEKRENVKKTLEKKQHQSQQKVQKTENYKDWFISYSFDPQEYEKLIYRNLNGTKNFENEILEMLEQNKTVKISDEKQEFSSIFDDEKIQDPDLKISQAKMQNQQQHYHHSISHALSLGSSNMFVKDIHYLGNSSQVEYFILILFDDTQAYVSQEDLVKYFPFVYEKFLIEKIDQSIQDGRNSLLDLNHQLNFMHLNCIKNLGKIIGFEKQDFDMSGETQNIFNPKRVNISISDTYYVYGDREVQIQNEKQSLIKKQQEEEQFFPLCRKQLELNIQNYFYFLKEFSHQAEIIQSSVQNQVSHQYNLKTKQNILFKLTRCKELFKKYQRQNKEDMTSSKKQKIEQQKSSSIPSSHNKISILKEKIIIKKTEKQIKTQQTIQSNSFQKLQKKSIIKNQKIQTEEKQIFEILNVLEEVHKGQDNFYDSDDQEN